MTFTQAYSILIGYSIMLWAVFSHETMRDELYHWFNDQRHISRFLVVVSLGWILIPALFIMVLGFVVVDSFRKWW